MKGTCCHLFYTILHLFCSPAVAVHAAGVRSKLGWGWSAGAALELRLGGDLEPDGGSAPDPGVPSAPGSSWTGTEEKASNRTW